jgi:hypothetical protein
MKWVKQRGEQQSHTSVVLISVELLISRPPPVVIRQLIVFSRQFPDVNQVTQASRHVVDVDHLYMGFIDDPERWWEDVYEQRCV